MMWKGLITVVGAVICLAAAGLSSQEKAGLPGIDVIVTRQASLDMSSITFHSMGDAMKAGREAKTQAYPALALAKWAKALPKMFPAGTGEGETSADSQARSAIWTDRANFDRAAAEYGEATAKLAALASTDDTAGFTKQLEEVNHACNYCHTRYKSGAQAPPKK
jgi:cytochrome c556